MFDIPAAVEAGSNLISKILDKIAPDADLEVRGQITQALQEMQNEYQIQLSQLTVNTEEAKHPSVFVAGWRPFIGWVGGLGIGYEILFKPIINGILAIFGLPPYFVGVDISLLQSIVGGMLGLGIARSWDKSKNVDTKQVK
jgi:hypothetical protein